MNRARGHRYLTGAAALAAAGAVAAGCGSSGTSSSAASASASPQTGTQTLSGSVAGQAALASSTSIPLRLTGLVNTTATISLAGTSKQNPVMIKTGQGTLAVSHTTGTSSQKLVSSATCRFAFANRSHYTVEGSKSTGTFKNATGSGTAVITFTGNLPKKSDGSCNTSSTAVPQPASARVSFAARGPLTVKK